MNCKDGLHYADLSASTKTSIDLEPFRATVSDCSEILCQCAAEQLAILEGFYRNRMHEKARGEMLDADAKQINATISKAVLGDLCCEICAKTLNSISNESVPRKWRIDAPFESRYFTLCFACITGKSGDELREELGLPQVDGDPHASVRPAWENPLGTPLAEMLKIADQLAGGAPMPDIELKMEITEVNKAACLAAFGKPSAEPEKPRVMEIKAKCLHLYESISGARQEANRIGYDPECKICKPPNPLGPCVVSDEDEEKLAAIRKKYLHDDENYAQRMERISGGFLKSGPVEKSGKDDEMDFFMGKGRHKK